MAVNGGTRWYKKRPQFGPRKNQLNCAAAALSAKKAVPPGPCEKVAQKTDMITSDDVLSI